MGTIEAERGAAVEKLTKGQTINKLEFRLLHYNARVTSNTASLQNWPSTAAPSSTHMPNHISSDDHTRSQKHRPRCRSTCGLVSKYTVIIRFGSTVIIIMRNVLREFISCAYETEYNFWQSCKSEHVENITFLLPTASVDYEPSS